MENLRFVEDGAYVFNDIFIPLAMDDSPEDAISELTQKLGQISVFDPDDDELDHRCHGAMEEFLSRETYIEAFIAAGVGEEEVQELCKEIDENYDDVCDEISVMRGDM